MEPYLHSFSDRVLLLTLAFAASLLLGGPRALHRLLLLDLPARLGRGVLAALGRKLNRAQRGRGARRIRGILLVLVVLGFCIGAGMLAEELAVLGKGGVIFEVALVAYLLPVRAVFERARDVRRALQEKNKPRAAELALPISRRDALPGDAHATIRVTVEYLALQFSRRVVAPVFWYLLVGFPAMLFVVALEVMDGMFGSRSATYAAFGSTTARLDDVVQLIPARIAAVLLALASIIAPGCNPLQSLRVAVGAGGGTVSPNSGAVLGAAAGALGLSLGGPRGFLGWAIQDRWIGSGTARVETVHLARMLYLYLCAAILVFLLVAAMNMRHLPPIPFL